MGAKARAMGGATIGTAHGAESGLSNPALITSVERKAVSFGGTVFMPKVSADMGAGSSDSAADMNVIPEVSIASKVTDNFWWGIGMWGTAGMGVDYRDEEGMTSNMNMVTNLQLMQFGVPLAYKMGGLSLGITPVLQYGSLDMNYKFDGNRDGTPENYGNGVAQDLQFGYNLGIAYQVAGLTVGAVYKSQIDMEYKGQLSAATQPFVDGGIFPGALEDSLSTPAEIGLGVSYTISGHTLAADYKQVKWSDADGYKDFNWDDQDVISVGYEYATKGWALRLGYNYASNPIGDAGAMSAADLNAAFMGGTFDPSMLGGNALNTFNLLGFPATVESHITLGGSYTISECTSIDLAYVYAPETTTTLATMPSNDPATGAFIDGETTVKHSQTSMSFQLNYVF